MNVQYVSSDPQPSIGELIEPEGPAKVRVYSFGEWVFRSSPRTLLKNGEPVEVRPQALQVLDVLLFYVGALVTREQLQEAIFSDRPFMDHRQAINLAVLYLRRALGDDARAPRYVETVARQGYRFIHPVEVESSSLIEVATPEGLGSARAPMNPEMGTADAALEAAELEIKPPIPVDLTSAPPSAGEERPTSRRPRRPATRVAAVAGALMVTLLTGGWLGERRSALGLSGAGEPRLVIAPLVEYEDAGPSSASQRQLAIAVTDELAARLHRLAEERWSVAVSPERSKGASAVLSGGVRRTGSGGVMTLRLTKPEDGVMLWSRTEEMPWEGLDHWLDSVENELAGVLDGAL